LPCWRWFLGNERDWIFHGKNPAAGITHDLDCPKGKGHGRVSVRVEAHRERLLAVKRGEVPWPEVDAWRKELHRDFESALAQTKLPERPDYEAANGFLIRARRLQVKQ
jgi:hypothetical protein